MIRYRLRLADLKRHLLEIELELDDPAEQTRLSLPSWTPGSYLLREYARHVVSASARSQGRAVELEKADKRSWLARGARGPLLVTIRVHALDLSVRGAYLDETRAFFNGSCVFLGVEGREREPAELVIEAPLHAGCASWRVATAMPAVDVDARGFGRYAVGDYDELIDHPVEIGEFARAEFVAAGIRHGVTISGRHSTDLERVAADLRQLCETQLRFFGEPAPFDHYLFLGLAVDQGYGGLEHRASASLLFNADDLPKPGEPGVPRSYRRLLSLASHEYFHAWNVKQLKPAAFTPYRLGERNHTRLLWVCEGITSYYQDLMLLRADLIGRDAYLDRLAQMLTKVYRTPGRFQQTVAEASFEAWDKLYKPEPNSANASVSYYSKGALVALALDLTVRRATQSAVSLDDIVLELWARFGRRGIGLGEADFETAAEAVSGIALGEFFEAAVRGTTDLPLPALLSAFGIDFELRAATGSQDPGGVVERIDAAPRASLGIAYKPQSAGLELTLVRDGGPAENAGLCAGDLLIAVDGYRVDASTLSRRLDRCEPGETVPVAYFRRNELREAGLTLEPAPRDTCGLAAVAEAPVEAQHLRQSWLGS